ncbi:MAG: hypothetical protein KGL35_13780 [Bradyrhizobium sp.]|nr:hypothetical protein [Bradyrhizobium sp.]
MNAIILQFIGSPDLGSQAIEWFSQGQVSHVDCVLEDGSLLGARNDVVMGIPAGVQIRPASYIGNDKAVRAVLPAPTSMIQDFYDYVRAQIGKPYDMEAILAFVAGRNWRNPAAWFCSELQGTMLEQCGYFATPLSTPTNKLTPAGLLLACSARAPVVMP